MMPHVNLSPSRLSAGHGPSARSPYCATKPRTNEPMPHTRIWQHSPHPLQAAPISGFLSIVMADLRVARRGRDEQVIWHHAGGTPKIRHGGPVAGRNRSRADRREGFVARQRAERSIALDSKPNRAAVILLTITVPQPAPCL